MTYLTVTKQQSAVCIYSYYDIDAVIYSVGSKLHEYCIEKFIYPQHNYLAPVEIMGDILYNHNVHDYNTRGVGNIHAQYYRTQIVANSFINKGQYHWQMIPDDIREVKTAQSVSGQLKHYFGMQIALTT